MSMVRRKSDCCQLSDYTQLLRNALMFVKCVIDSNHFSMAIKMFSLSKTKAMLEQMNPAEVEDLLHQQLVGRIGCHTGELTYVVPISYAYSGGYVYCHTFDGMKVDMMRKNPEVCFQVDNTKNLANWQSVIAWGSFEELPAEPGRSEAIKILRERKLPILSSQTMQLGSQWPFVSADDQIEGILFRIYLKKKTGRRERNEDRSFFAT